VYRVDGLLCLIIEWEKDELYASVTGAQLPGSLRVDEALHMFIHDVQDYAIFLLDARGSVVTWNTGAELNMGYKEEEILGTHFSSFYGSEEIHCMEAERHLKTCLRQGRSVDEGWRWRKDGNQFWASSTMTALFKNDAHVGFGMIIRTLTELEP